MPETAEKTAHFGGDYVRYWRERVVASPDGTPASTPQALRSCLPELDLQPGQTVVDLGCGFGRMLPLLEGEGRSVVGVDLSAEMVDAAAILPYAAVLRGTVEDTRLPSAWADRMLCWATFDVAEQEQGWKELWRVLRPSGRVLLSGKNDLYRHDDEPALVAERNAFLKDFPNHFTDVAAILRADASWGFRVVRAWGYERRGDLGEDRRFDLLQDSERPFYEFVFVLERAEGGLFPERLCGPHSRTMLDLCRRAGLGEDVAAFARRHREIHGETFPVQEGAGP